MYSGKRVLVTGAGGFIGSHLTEALIQQGAHVRAFLRYTSQGSVGMLQDIGADKLADVECIWGDVRDADAVRKAAKDCAVVFHLAALVGIPYSYQHPREVWDTNTIGTLNVLTAALDGPTRIVTFSTSETYGSAQYTPMDERHPAHAQSPYAASKVGADELARSFHLSFGLPVVIARPFNTYGPRQSTRAVISTILTQALAGREVRLGSLSPRRDLTYVSDTVAGVMALGECDAATGLAVNIGSGFSVSVGDLVNLCSAALGRTLSPVCDAERVRPEGSEVVELLCDASLLHNLTGWQPTIGLETGLAHTAEWLAAHHQASAAVPRYHR